MECILRMKPHTETNLALYGVSSALHSFSSSLFFFFSLSSLHLALASLHIQGILISLIGNAIPPHSYSGQVWKTGDLAGQEGLH